MNERFQAALKAENQNTPPIWMMRQAGRYHSHYQALRKQHEFIELCKNPLLACQVAMGPVEEFDFDLAILFSDLLFPLEALGMGLSYDPGPKMGFHLTHETLEKLGSVEEAVPHLEFQKEAMRLTRSSLPSTKSLIGFVGGPWTLFTYAVEGAHKGGLEISKSAIQLYDKFLDSKLMPLLRKNIQLQFEGGAEVVMVLDTSSGALGPIEFSDWVVPRVEWLAAEFPGRLGYYAKGVTPKHFEADVFSDGRLAGIGFDHRIDLSEMLERRRGIVGFTQGNFDQSLMFLPEPEFSLRLTKYFSQVQALDQKARAGWVCGLGHGILPKTPEQNVKSFVRIAREMFL